MTTFIITVFVSLFCFFMLLGTNRIRHIFLLDKVRKKYYIIETTSAYNRYIESQNSNDITELTKGYNDYNKYIKYLEGRIKQFDNLSFKKLKEEIIILEEMEEMIDEYK